MFCSFVLSGWNRLLVRCLGGGTKESLEAFLIWCCLELIPNESYSGGASMLPKIQREKDARRQKFTSIYMSRRKPGSFDF